MNNSEQPFGFGIEELDINPYLEINNLKEFSNFHFEEEDFKEYPEALNIAKEFWEYKNYKNSSNTPYTFLKHPADYAAVVFMKNNPDYSTINLLSTKKENIINEIKFFVEILIEDGYQLSDFFNIPTSSVENILKSI